MSSKRPTSRWPFPDLRSYPKPIPLKTNNNTKFLIARQLLRFSTTQGPYAGKITTNDIKLATAIGAIVPAEYAATDDKPSYPVNWANNARSLPSTLTHWRKWATMYLEKNLDLTDPDKQKNPDKQQLAITDKGKTTAKPATLQVAGHTTPSTRSTLLGFDTS
jgi:hypothetical protein